MMTSDHARVAPGCGDKRQPARAAAAESAAAGPEVPTYEPCPCTELGFYEADCDVCDHLVSGEAA